ASKAHHIQPRAKTHVPSEMRRGVAIGSERAIGSIGTEAGDDIRRDRRSRRRDAVRRVQRSRSDVRVAIPTERGLRLGVESKPVVCDVGAEAKRLHGSAHHETAERVPASVGSVAQIALRYGYAATKTDRDQ